MNTPTIGLSLALSLLVAGLLWPAISRAGKPPGARLARYVSKERSMIDAKKLRMDDSKLAKLILNESARLTVLADSPPFRLDPWAHEPTTVNAVVEIPKGSRNKYELDKKTGLIRLDRHVAASVQYPVDYGIVPQTLLEDGDPLDILLIVEDPTFPGCVVEARPIGLLNMFEKGDEDYKILAVPVGAPMLAGYRGLGDVPDALLREVEHFFNTYKQLEGGKVETFGWSDAADARLVIDESHRRWQEARRLLDRSPGDRSR